uniref:Uncharacterized protein n=1 Tax=Rhizophora mucronata TaxID=61149 RepID=A0A2P2QVE8_RHIMU
MVGHKAKQVIDRLWFYCDKHNLIKVKSISKGITELKGCVVHFGVLQAR